MNKDAAHLLAALAVPVDHTDVLARQHLEAGGAAPRLEVFLGKEVGQRAVCPAGNVSQSTM